VLSADGAGRDDGRTALQRICRAAGVPDEGATRIDGLLHRFGEERGRPVPILLIDGPDQPGVVPADLASLASAGLWSGTFKLVVTGPTGLAGLLIPERPRNQADRITELTVPPLDAGQVANYVRCWLKATRAPEAAAIHLSADAMLLLAHRSGGRPGQVDTLAWNMLALAAGGGRPTLTSWHAWAASAEAPWTDASPPEATSMPPLEWPNPEARRVLDQCRKVAGLPPWPDEKRR
jgi:hypothetical protein